MDVSDSTDGTALDGVVAGGHRRIDRVLASDFIEGIGEMAMSEVRARRDELDQEEVDLSYLRRLLQARLDLVGAELARRASGSAAPTDVVAYLAEVLSDGVRPPARGSGRQSLHEPSRAGENRRSVEQLVSDALLTDLQGAPTEELEGARDVLARGEAGISSQRAAVQAVLDVVQAEIGRRYRDGEASVDTLLAEGSRSR